MPHLGEGAVRIEVDCKHSTTGLTSVPGPLDLPTPALITAACFEHEARCGECDVSQAHARGATGLRAETERVYAQMQQRWQRRYAHGRRN
jgi:hypothetical protein